MMAIGVAKARAELAEVVDRVKYTRERVVLNKNGKRVAALVPIEDLELLERLQDRLDVEEAEGRLADPTQKPVRFKRST